MGQKTVRFSDLSGELIMSDDALARIVVHEHPELADGSVEIEALADEARTIEKAALPVAVMDLYFPGGDGPHRVTMTAEAFDKLAADKPVSELLISARPARRTPRAAAAPTRDRTDYASLEHAGKPHKGRITDGEKQLVRENLAAINKRLAADGMRTISLSDPEHVERYGLEGMDSQPAADPR